MVTIQFPDPHFKNKHKKRRVVNPALVDTIVRHLAPGKHVFVQSGPRRTQKAPWGLWGRGLEVTVCGARLTRVCSLLIAVAVAVVGVGVCRCVGRARGHGAEPGGPPRPANRCALSIYLSIYLSSWAPIYAPI